MIKQGAHRRVHIGRKFVKKVGLKSHIHNLHEYYVWKYGTCFAELLPYLPETVDVRRGGLIMPRYEQRNKASQIQARDKVFADLVKRFPTLKKNKVHRNNVGFRPDGTIVLLDLADIYSLVSAAIEEARHITDVPLSADRSTS